MACDLAEFGIRVNALSPGIMLTETATAQLNRPGGADWFMNRVMTKRMVRSRRDRRADCLPRIFDGQLRYRHHTRCRRRLSSGVARVYLI